ncbi:MAG: hypothetical protein ABJL13_05835, partial [Tateyamaria sp.]
MKKFPILAFVCAVMMCLFNTKAEAQSDEASDAAQANNPLADITAFNIQNYYIRELTGPGDFDANQFVLRYAKPVQIGNS